MAKRKSSFIITHNRTQQLRLLFAVVFSLLICGVTPSIAAQDDLAFSGLIKKKLALSLTDTRFEKSDITIEPELNYGLSPVSQLTLKGRLRLGLIDRLEPGQPTARNRADISGRWLVGDRLEFELREAFLDTEIGDSFLRLGKQQIVWGQADGLKVLDILNPQSFREFILEDYEDSRIPLWSVNAEIPIHDYTLQLVWIPDTTYHDIPARGSRYAPRWHAIAPPIATDRPVTQHSYAKPDNPFKDSDIGLRLSRTLGRWDLSLNYAYHYDDSPVVRRHVTEGGTQISQTYERTHLLGGSYSTAFGNFVLRGEVGYATDRYFSTDQTSENHGVHQSDLFSTVIGLDYAGLTDWFISAQYFQDQLITNHTALLRDRVQRTATLLVRRNFMNERLQAEALVIKNLHQNDGQIQMAVKYEWQDSLWLHLGADLFFGEINSLHGQFRHHDRLTVGIEFGF